MGVADSTTAIVNAIAAAAATANAGGADVWFPPGQYKVTSVLILPTGVRLRGAGGSNRWGQNSTTYPTRINYSGTVACIALQPGASGHIRNVKIQNLHFDGTAATGAVDGLLLDSTAAGADIVGCVYEDCMWSNFPRSQVNQPVVSAVQTVWGQSFVRCSFHDRDRVPTGNLVEIDGDVSHADAMTFDDCIWAPFQIGEWAMKATGSDTRVIGGVVQSSNAGGANGLWLIGGSTVIGTHIEGLGSLGIGARLVGTAGHHFMPSFCCTWGTGVSIGDTTTKATAVAGVTIGGRVSANGTVDVLIVDGGNRSNTLLLSMGTNPVVTDNRAVVDGVFTDVTRLDSSFLSLPTGTAAAPMIRSEAFANAGLYIDGATGDVVFVGTGTARSRSLAGGGFSIPAGLGAADLLITDTTAIAGMHLVNSASGKYLRANSANLDVVNAAGLAVIFAIDDAGHIFGGSGAAPGTSALGANVTSVTFTGNDVRGTIAIVMAGALAANTRIATCTFAASYGAAAPVLMLSNETAGVGLLSVNFYRQAVSTGVSFDLASDFALGAGTYTCAYIAIG